MYRPIFTSPEAEIPIISVRVISSANPENRKIADSEVAAVRIIEIPLPGNMIVQTPSNFVKTLTNRINATPEKMYLIASPFILFIILFPAKAPVRTPIATGAAMR